MHDDPIRDDEELNPDALDALEEEADHEDGTVSAEKIAEEEDEEEDDDLEDDEEDMGLDMDEEEGDAF